VFLLLVLGVLDAEVLSYLHKYKKEKDLSIKNP